MVKNRRFIIASNNLAKTKELITCFKWFNQEAVSYQALMPRVEFPLEGTDSYLENAKQKADFVARQLPDEWVVADDSGMLLKAYPDWLGVLTSRQLDIKSMSDEVLNQKIINLVKNKDRTVKMLSTLVMINNGKMITAKGEFKGTISLQPLGTNGKGFDLILIPQGYQQTLAQLDKKTKFPLLHRTKAVENLITSLNEE